MTKRGTHPQKQNQEGKLTIFSYKNTNIVKAIIEIKAQCAPKLDISQHSKHRETNQYS